MTDPEPPKDLSELERCPACDAERVGDFCHACGQRYPVGRLTIGGLVRELPTRLFNFDRGLLHTFLAMVRRPGAVPRDYVNGRRSPYISPLTYFLVAATVQLIALTLSQDVLLQHIGQQLAQDPMVGERLTERLGEDALQTVGKIYLSLLKQAYTYLFLLCMSLPFALYLRLFTGRLPPRHNLAELLVFSIFTSAHMVLVTGLILPVTTRISPLLHVTLSVGLYATIGLFAARDFFDGGWRRYPLVLISLVAAMGTFFVSLMILFTAIIVSKGASFSG